MTRLWSRWVLLLVPVLGAALCQPAPAPLVLSGDEVLQSGPLALDERELRAVVTADGVRVRGRVRSQLELSLGGRVLLSLRDLQERAVGEGSGELVADAGGAWFEVWLRPGLADPGPATLAGHVLHGTVEDLGHTLRFRRSLYQAAQQLEAELVVPALPLPGQHLPALVAAPAAPPGTVLDLRAESAGGGVEELAQVALDATGVASVLVRAPEASADARVLRAELVAEDLRLRFPLRLPLTEAPRLALWTSGPAAAPGDRVDVVAWVRGPDARPLPQRDGSLCLAGAVAASGVCWRVETDATGLIAESLAIAPVLAGRRLVLSVEVAGARAHAALQVAPVTAVEAPLPVAAGAPWHEADALVTPWQAPPVGPGYLLHGELRLGSGPLLAEREYAYAQAPGTLHWPLPAAAVAAATHWVLRVGVEDGVGRRAARDHEFVAAAQDLAVGLHVPAELRAGQPFCAVAVVRGLDGQAVEASGALQVDGAVHPLRTSPSGDAVVCGLVAAAGARALDLALVGADGRQGEAQREVQIAAADDAGLALALPLVVPAGERLPLLIETRGALALRTTWLLDRGRPLVVTANPATLLPAAGGPVDRELVVAAIASDGDGRLWVRERRVLARDDGVRLQLEAAPGGMLRPLLDRRHDEAAPIALLLGPAAGVGAAGLQLEPGRARDLATQQASPEAAAALVQALPTVPALALARASAEIDAAVLQVAVAKVAADLDAIVEDLALRLAQGEVTAAELPSWVERRARVYYDPWGQPYDLVMADGQLGLHSAGFDELADTDDDARAGRYLHGLVQAAATPAPVGVVAADWASARRPRPLARLTADATFAPSLDGQARTVQALLADGGQLSRQTPAQAGPELHAPGSLRLRAGDQLDVPVYLLAPRLDGLDAWVDGAGAPHLDVDPALPVEASAPGWQRRRLALRARRTSPASLTLHAATADWQRQRPVAVLARDQHQERATLDRLGLWLAEEARWTLQPDASLARRQRVLRARAFVDGGSLARELIAALPTPLSVDDARAQLALLPTADAARELPRQWALAAVLARQQDDGGLLGDDGRPSLRATLAGVEVLARAEAAGALQPALDAALGLLAAAQDSSGALTPERLVTDARALAREQLRASARLVLAIAPRRPAHEALRRATAFVQAAVRDDHDAATTALALRALQAAGADDATLEALALRLRARTALDPRSGVTRFAAEPDDGAEGLLLANAHGLLALRALGVWDALAQAARDVVLSAVWPDHLRASVATQEVALQALAAMPAASGEPVEIEVELDGGPSIRVGPDAAVALAAPAGALAGSARVVAAPALLLLWVEGEPVLPLAAGPTVAMPVASPLALRAGEVLRLPVELAADGVPLRVEIQSSPCLVAALHTPRQRLTPRADGLAEGLLGADELAATQVVLQALCPGRLSLPVLRVASLAEPWRASTSAPGLVVIDD